MIGWLDEWMAATATAKMSGVVGRGWEGSGEVVAMGGEGVSAPTRRK